MKQAAKAIIYENDQYLLQLRDDKASIPYPNCWSFFGGEIETLSLNATFTDNSITLPYSLDNEAISGYNIFLISIL